MDRALEVAAWALLGALTLRQLQRRRRSSPPAAVAADVSSPTPAVRAAVVADAEEQAALKQGKAASSGAGGIHITASSVSSGSEGGMSSSSSSSAGSGGSAADEAALDRAAHAIVDTADEEAHKGVHLVGSSVNIPDMSANLKAKVTVSEAQQSDPRLLARVYDDMADKFGEHGLNLPAIEAMRQYFEGLEGPGEARPLEYERFPVPLPPGSVRLGVVFFQEINQRLADMVHQAAHEVVAALPEGSQFHVNKPSHYHVTVFMTSMPHTLRPNPFNPAFGGLPVDGTPQEQAEASRPDPQHLHQEIEAFRVAAAGTDAPRFEVHRLLMADSGTLLLCSVDHTSNLAKLRKRLRHAFPGAPPKQSTIVHASIARLLTPRQLSREEIERVQAVCDAWTERLRGQLFYPKRIYHIQEHTFTTVEGPRIPLPFKLPAAAGSN